ncbi:LysR family transcriptional regulator [Variovorax sp. PCZ-1]|uniref:LysR family transcriptional regulator n=1 Tax=Variovorax sp. PCZ-1 TaxID=2835533 RepID=UPI001BCDA780|nr:LysR family transcriptional regulator [Variovorax sp. PCZ-1]MBS7807708.1 LysR family transcriptional regulator [Variovorax sp. PCZ-1]
MQTLRGILNFSRTAELGSFAKAAKELGISPVAVSQNISRLEAALGVRLFARSTRALQLTPEGQAFLEQCRQPLAQLDAACKEVASDAKTASGKLRATVVSPVAYLYLIPLLPKFQQRYPGIRLELELSEDASPLIPKRFDVGIRIGALNDAAFVARPLGPLRLLICASPTYLESQEKPNSLDDLAKHRLLQLQITGKEQTTPFIVQTRVDGARNMQFIQLPGHFICNDFRGLAQACGDGLGIAQLPQPVALPMLKSGQLKVLLPDSVAENIQLFIHYPSRKQLPARVRAFVDFVVEHFAGHPDLTADISGFVA